MKQVLRLCLLMTAVVAAESVKTFHIAMVTSCDSHKSITKPIAHSLLKHSAYRDKFRVTYVIGEECKEVPMSLGVPFHNTGKWFFPNYDLTITTSQYYANSSVG